MSWERTLCWLAILSLLGSTSSRADENLLINGGFEQGVEGWAKAWSRTPGVAVALDGSAQHGGKSALRIEHQAAEDWNVAQQKRLPVKPGEIYELSGWVRAQGKGDIGLSVITYDGKQQALEWSYGRCSLTGSGDWQRLCSRFLIKNGAVEIVPRITGHGVIQAWVDDLSLRLVDRIELAKFGANSPPLTLRNRFLEASFSSSDGAITLTDLRNKHVWKQQVSKPLYVLSASSKEGILSATVLEPEKITRMTLTLKLEGDAPELVVELSGQGPMERVAFPHPFASPPGSWLIMPVNEGISYPVDDASLKPMHYYLYGGHGLCMAWYGVTDQKLGLMTLVETPDDAAVDVPRNEGRLQLAPEWEPERGEFGYPRKLRYIVFDSGGYVAMAKRHRQHAQATGLLKTLQEKREKNPKVDLLVGAVNVWAMGMEGPKLCEEMQSLGIQRILWSAGGKPEQIETLNRKPGILTSRYDIYQDCMDPANFPKLRSLHKDWTSEGWPKDIMIKANGDWIRGWGVESKDGEMFSCGVLCDRLAPDYARRRIGEERKTLPLQCRFIDTTTASPWRECYAPAHPLTRRESRRSKMELLDVISREFNLVTGSETGHEASVPFLHYFEGMLSLGPYRIPDSGRKTSTIIDEAPERVEKFQTGHYYRLPLWELVYHDCTVAQWYWGDYNNKLPKLWDRRDLFNALYGTPPMFLFVRKFWEENRERFVQSYRTATPVARATGYSEMLSHEWLNEDHSVQQTRFGNGTVVTVNFGGAPFRLKDGTLVGPMQHQIQGPKIEE